MNVKLNLCALFLVGFSTISYANMSVYPMSVDMNNQGEGNVRVISRTNDVQFIKTTIVKISDAGTAKEKENEIKTGDPNAIVVMPPKFALPAGASKMVRLVSMEPALQETTYRVKFEAVSQLDDPLEGTKGTKTQLNINLIWGVLVSVPPEHPELKMSLQPGGEITNNGNQRFKVLKIGLCKKAQADKECAWQDVGRNLYPTAHFAPKNILNYDRVVIQYWNWIDKTRKSQSFSIH
ncbi:TPA: fimbria/pilus periplasmic chaperone [Klebsiella oxytoca]|uniref:fimbria/pilus periplasmic chaperone n=1 Tax=Klebsiella oxytoca TaxID=571 RepID=UPI00024FF6FE|nr:fimbria/pilus periplasmic chaperone [Klebsiella oxytoca]EHS92229.1 hypothetical protein HMPREF9689_03812 [Klebsiella oxytoca 10-5245]HAT3717755.1 fimbria/pilus periplasmic chaperone [Klebsiella oxytoca]HBL6845134.1 fimbria/pilus periplasmic chaperone [Klebsiella oxytoca]HBM3152072.1 fimbria/pilus periplasmic chaperone [Klebsiella oxytoca]HCJ0412694.1 fimbria/pilus periplasmic chaperone [Klebsiella oxytoca]